MKTKLITALRTAANALEWHTFEYDWRHPASCNCGIIACALMGKSVSEMQMCLSPMIQTVKASNWNYLVAKHCPITGIPENEIFAALLGAGMTQKDIVHLEMLSDPEVMKRTKWPQKVATGTVKKKRFFGEATEEPAPYDRKRYHMYPENAIAYMRAWADLLTEQGKQDQPETEKAHVTQDP